MDIWLYYKVITRRLLAWSVINATACLVLLLFFDLLHALGVPGLESTHG